MIINITVPTNKKVLIKEEKWFVYILECKDKSYYTGITNNLERRIKTHNSKRGAKYTRCRVPVTLVYYETVENKNKALKRELAIKRLTRVKKEKLIQQKS